MPISAITIAPLLAGPVLVVEGGIIDPLGLGEITVDGFPATTVGAGALADELDQATTEGVAAAMKQGLIKKGSKIGGPRNIYLRMMLQSNLIPLRMMMKYQKWQKKHRIQQQMSLILHYR